MSRTYAKINGFPQTGFLPLGYKNKKSHDPKVMMHTNGLVSAVCRCPMSSHRVIQHASLISVFIASVCLCELLAALPVCSWFVIAIESAEVNLKRKLFFLSL